MAEISNPVPSGAGASAEMKGEGPLEAVILGIFSPGTSRRTFQVLNGVVIALLACITFLLLSTDRKLDDVRVHIWIMLLLACGLLLSVNWYLMTRGPEEEALAEGEPTPAAEGQEDKKKKTSPKVKEEHLASSSSQSEGQAVKTEKTD